MTILEDLYNIFAARVAELSPLITDYENKKMQGLDIKTEFALTDVQVESKLKARLKPKIVQIRATLADMITQIKTIDSTIT